MSMNLWAEHRAPRKAAAKHSNGRLKKVTRDYCQSVGTDSSECSDAIATAKSFKDQVGDGNDGYIKDIHEQTKTLQDYLKEANTYSESSSDSSVI